MSCTAYIVYTFHLSFHHANFGQFKAEHVLYKIKLTCKIEFAKYEYNTSENQSYGD